MTGEQAAAAVISALQTIGIPFMVVGSFARNFYAFSRSTRDVDVVVQCEAAMLGRLFDALPKDLIPDPQASFEMVTGTRRFILLVNGSDFKVEIFLLSDDAHDQTRFEKRVAARIGVSEVFLPTPEDLIVQKLRWAHVAKRTKDYDDALDVLSVQRQHLNLTYMREWADRHGTRTMLEEMLAVSSEAV